MHITHSECVFVTLCIQHAMRMRRIILSSVACPARPYFSTLPHKRLCFRKKKELWNLRCVFYTTFVWIMSHSKKNWTRCDQIWIIGLHEKYPLFLSDFDKIWIFWTECRKILKYQISLKFFRWEPSCSMKTDGLTDMTKLIVAFLNFTKAPKNESKLNHVQKIVMGIITVP